MQMVGGGGGGGGSLNYNESLVYRGRKIPTPTRKSMRSGQQELILQPAITFFFTDGRLQC